MVNPCCFMNCIALPPSPFTQPSTFRYRFLTFRYEIHSTRLWSRPLSTSFNSCEKDPCTRLSFDIYLFPTSQKRKMFFTFWCETHSCYYAIKCQSAVISVSDSYPTPRIGWDSGIPLPATHTSTFLLPKQFWFSRTKPILTSA